VHHLQREAEGVTSSELQQLLREFYLERLTVLMRHEASARHVTDYDVNNAYQYIISREETHISWLQHALVQLGEPLPPDPSSPTVSALSKAKDAEFKLYEEDAHGNQRFVDTWRDRIEHVTNARHKGMLNVILGEMLEHERLFQQASEGRTDIIGKPMAIHERRGKVLPTRWVE
jgi:rubrerythrin